MISCSLSFGLEGSKDLVWLIIVLDFYIDVLVCHIFGHGKSGRVIQTGFSGGNRQVGRIHVTGGGAPGQYQGGTCAGCKKELSKVEHAGH